MSDNLAGVTREIINILTKNNQEIQNRLVETCVLMDEYIPQLKSVETSIQLQKELIKNQKELIEKVNKELVSSATKAFEKINESNITTANSWKRSAEEISQAKELLLAHSKTSQEAAKDLNRSVWVMIVCFLLVFLVTMSSALGWPFKPKEKEIVIKNPRSEWVIDRLNQYLINDLYPNLNPKRQNEIQLMYKELDLKIDPPNPSGQ